MNNYQLILGVRELPRPRGTGYLYYKILSLQEEAQKRILLKRILNRIDCFLRDGGEKFLFYLDLYCKESNEVEEAKLEELLHKALVKLFEIERFSNKEARELLSNYKTENMETWVIEILDRIVRKFVSVRLEELVTERD